jgi:DNA-binding transcriptional MerR regulator
VLHLITRFSCIRSKTGLSFRLELSIDQSGFAMDTNPQHDAPSRLPHGVPNGHADSLEQYAGSPEAEAISRLSTIREMARDFQVSIRALRFYEDRGLLHPRRESTNRRYDARDRLHLKTILKGKHLGFTLSEIHDILACQGEDSGKTELEMGLLPEQISAQISYLERQRSQIDSAIRTLREAHRRRHESPRQGAGL